MKETEAHTKWCPYASFVIAGGTAPATMTAITSRQVGKALDPTTLCLGKGCMAWRESLIIGEDGVTEEMGYCGLTWRGL